MAFTTRWHARHASAANCPCSGSGSNALQKANNPSPKNLLTYARRSVSSWAIADMYILSVATTASEPNCSLMVVNPARSPNRMVAVRCSPRMDKASGLAAKRSTSCGLTRARNWRVMRAFSRWFTTAAVETLAA